MNFAMQYDENWSHCAPLYTKFSTSEWVWKRNRFSFFFWQRESEEWRL